MLKGVSGSAKTNGFSTISRARQTSSRLGPGIDAIKRGHQAPFYFNMELGLQQNTTVLNEERRKDQAENGRQFDQDIQ